MLKKKRKRHFRLFLTNYGTKIVVLWKWKKMFCSCILIWIMVPIFWYKGGKWLVYHWFAWLLTRQGTPSGPSTWLPSNHRMPTWPPIRNRGPQRTSSRLFAWPQAGPTSVGPLHPTLGGCFTYFFLGHLESDLEGGVICWCPCLNVFTCVTNQSHLILSLYSYLIPKLL